VTATPKAKPARGPITTPAIQLLLLEVGSGFDDAVGEGIALELGMTLLVEEAADWVEDVVSEDVAPLRVISTHTRNSRLWEVILGRTVTMLTTVAGCKGPLIIKPADEICCAKGGWALKAVKRSTQMLLAERAEDGTLTSHW
jgi:hypothetical protein